MESYNNAYAVQEAEKVISEVKKFYLGQTRLAMQEIYDSIVFTEAMKEVGIFLVLNLINRSTVSSDIGQLTDILRRFGTAPSYDDLAKLCFPNCIGTELSIISDYEIHIKVFLSATEKEIVTQDGENIVTQDNLMLVAATRQTQQNRNDYIFLVNYLAPNRTVVTVEYLGG
jgi:hypothetical protein